MVAKRLQVHRETYKVEDVRHRTDLPMGTRAMGEMEGEVTLVWKQRTKSGVNAEREVGSSSRVGSAEGHGGAGGDGPVCVEGF